MVASPSARIRAASDPEPARPTPSSASGAEPGCADHGQHVAAQAAEVRSHDRHGGAGGHGGVGARATPGQDADPGGHRQLVGRRHQAAHARARAAKGARGRLISEDHHGAQHLAPLHPAEGTLDAVDADRLGHEAVEVEAPVEVQVDQHREVPRRAGSRRTSSA